MKFHLGTNWKMHKTNTQARQFIAEFIPLVRERCLEALSICHSLVYLAAACP
jgi:triosephosphate isomerase